LFKVQRYDWQREQRRLIQDIQNDNESIANFRKRLPVFVQQPETDSFSEGVEILQNPERQQPANREIAEQRRKNGDLDVCINGQIQVPPV
jgi:hypothetical protein